MVDERRNLEKDAKLVMKSVHKWATITTLFITVVLILILIFLIDEDKLVIFAIFSGVIASMIVMAISNCISWLLSKGQEKQLLRNKYTEIIDIYGDSLHIIKYALSYSNGLPGVTELLSKYQELCIMFQGLFILHNRDKMPDYFKLKSSIGKIATSMKKMNNVHKVVKTDKEILASYSDIVKYLSKDTELCSFINEVVNLQDDSITNQNKDAKN